ncbi:MAG: hypothetical protein EP340_08715 [Alphaproteobacteria bacterium]|nr:MAG: hypothetical protein EP340_08715 [Alphaproteobacteria bacterium]
MHIDGLRRRRLALLKKKKFDLRDQHFSSDNLHEDTSDRKSRESEIDREISLLECARRDLI